MREKNGSRVVTGMYTHLLQLCKCGTIFTAIVTYFPTVFAAMDHIYIFAKENFKKGNAQWLEHVTII